MATFSRSLDVLSVFAKIQSRFAFKVESEEEPEPFRRCSVLSRRTVCNRTGGEHPRPIHIARLRDPPSREPQKNSNKSLMRAKKRLTDGLRENRGTIIFPTKKQREESKIRPLEESATTSTFFWPMYFDPTSEDNGVGRGITLLRHSVEQVLKNQNQIMVLKETII